MPCNSIHAYYTPPVDIAPFLLLLYYIFKRVKYNYIKLFHTPSTAETKDFITSLPHDDFIDCLLFYGFFF